MASLTGPTFDHRYAQITSTEAVLYENAKSEGCWVGHADVTQHEFTAALTVLSGASQLSLIYSIWITSVHI